MFRSIPIISVVAVFILFLALLGGYYLWLPKYNTFEDLKLTLEAKKEQIASAEEHFAKLRSLSLRLEEHQEEVEKIDAALPVEFSISALFNFIQQNSSKNGLILEGINLEDSSLSGLGKTVPVQSTSPAKQTEQQENAQPGDAIEKSKNDIMQIPFSISVFGSYAGFKDFLSATHKSARIIEINSIGFSSDVTQEAEEMGAAEGRDLFMFDLHLKTHHYKTQ